MTNGFSPGPWLSERKSVRKLTKLGLIPVEMMRTQWQVPSPWLQCDSHVQRTMAISRQLRRGHRRAHGQSAAAAARRPRRGGFKLRPCPCHALGRGPTALPVELGRNCAEPKAVFKHGKSPAREPQLALAGRRQSRN